MLSMNWRVLLALISTACILTHSTAGACPKAAPVARKNAEKQKISGGAPAPCGRYPFVASLKDPISASHACGGVLIHPQFVLTSGSCLQDLSPGPIEVFIGGLVIDDAPERREGTLIPNENFRRGQPLAGNDIGLLKLDRASKAQIAQLPNSSPSPGEQLTAIGWGRNSPRAAFVSNLMERGGLKVIPKEECSIKHEFRTKNLLCAGIEDAACRGDEGSGLLKVGNGEPQNDVVVGIALSAEMFKSECDVRGKPGIFTNVETHLDWIKQKING